jgi:transcriptional regulator with GAF, ATPase, and Fis domain
MVRKLISIRSRNQITLPQELAELWKVGEGDYLSAQIAEDGKVSLTPARVAVEGSAEAVQQNRQAEADIKAGRYRTFEDAESFARSLKEMAPVPTTAKDCSMTLNDDIERVLILTTLQATNWNKRAAAKRLNAQLKKFPGRLGSEKAK